MSFNYGPVPPENNPPINPQYYQPSAFSISNIALGANTVVQTSVPNNYVVGQTIRLLIPFNYGSRQINGRQGYVTSIVSSTEFVTNIDSTNCNAFIPSPSYVSTPAQVTAIGDINSGPTNANYKSVQTFISGSFINISPN